MLPTEHSNHFGWWSSTIEPLQYVFQIWVHDEGQKHHEEAGARGAITGKQFMHVAYNT